MSHPFASSPARMAALVLSAAGLLGGCASTTPNYDARFGQSVRQNLQAQVIDPRAAEKQEPPTGVDGVSSREAIQRYRDSYRTPPPVVNVINIGGSR